MTIIEALLPDGSVHVFTTVERSHAAIAEETARRFPDASHWRISKDWRSLDPADQPSATASFLQRARPALIVLILAIVLTPVISWAATLDKGPATVLDWFSGRPAASAVEADELTAAPATEPASAAQDVHIVGIAEQSSDTSRTLRIKLRNDGAQLHENVRLRAIFYDKFGTKIAAGEGSEGVITLAPQEEGFVKVWARSDYGIGQYELEVLDSAP